MHFRRKGLSVSILALGLGCTLGLVVGWPWNLAEAKAVGTGQATTPNGLVRAERSDEIQPGGRPRQATDKPIDAASQGRADHLTDDLRSGPAMRVGDEQGHAPEQPVTAQRAGPVGPTPAKNRYDTQRIDQPPPPLAIVGPAAGLADDQRFYQATRQAIAAFVDTSSDAARERLRRLAISREADLRRAAADHDLPFEIDDAQGWRRLIGFDGNRPRYAVLDNEQAAISTAANLVRRQPTFATDLDGSGCIIQVFDGSWVYDHDAFADGDGGFRVRRIAEQARNDLTMTQADSHAMHVAGTLIADGDDDRIRGMAPGASVASLPGYNVATQAYLAMTHPFQTDLATIGNASLGSQDKDGGGYEADDAAFDELVRQQIWYLHFFSIGNAGDLGFDTISGDGFPKEAKNVVLVGAVADAPRDADGRLQLEPEVLDFSSRGPCDDGRIKPDLVANGQQLRSTHTVTVGGASTSTVLSGTSMASPNAAGSAVLLQDYHQRRFGAPMPAPTLKALLLHGADDLGEPGPDYRSGWGLVNTRRSAAIIRQAADEPATRPIVEGRLAVGAVWQRRYQIDATDELQATLVWWDPPLEDNQFSRGSEDQRAPDLVNDLDLRLIAPDGVVHYPYLMPYVASSFDTDTLDRSAVRGDNDTDNVEMIRLPMPMAGIWTVQISHEGALRGDEQAFSLICTGASEALDWPFITGIEPAVARGTRVPLTIAGESFAPGATVELRRPGAAAINADAVRQADGSLRIRADLADAAAGSWDVVVQNPDGGSDRAVGLLLVPATGSPFFHENFDSAADPAERGWQRGGATSETVWQLSTERALGSRSLRGADRAAETDRWIATPPIAMPADFDADLRLRFSSYSDTETGWDGVVLEVAIDDEAWAEISTREARFVTGGYFGELGSGPLENRQAWHGQSGGWLTTEVALAAARYAGRSARFRWRFSADTNTAVDGWYLDAVELVDLQNERQARFISDPATVAVVGRTFTYEAQARAADDATLLAIGAARLPDWLELIDSDPTRPRLRGNPTAADLGPHAVVLQAGLVGETAICNQRFTIQVKAETTNLPPQAQVLSPTAEDLSIADASHSLHLRATSSDDALPDGGSLASGWLQLGGPALVTFVADGADSVRVDFASAGIYSLGYSVSDGAEHRLISRQVRVGTTVPIGLALAPAIVGELPNEVQRGAPMQPALRLDPRGTVEWLLPSGCSAADPTALNSPLRCNLGGLQRLRLRIDGDAASVSRNWSLTVVDRVRRCLAFRLIGTLPPPGPAWSLRDAVGPRAEPQPDGDSWRANDLPAEATFRARPESEPPLGDN